MQCNTLKFRVDYDESDLGAYDTDTGEVTVNLTNIKESCDDYNADFYTMLMHVINHEVLHYVLHVEQGKQTTYDLDNLTHGNQTDDNIWEYWIS